MKTIKDLALALINATLILLAVCLFFGWQIFAAAERSADKLTSAVENVRPLRDEIAGTRTALEALRGDIAALGSDQLSGPESQALQTRLATLDSRMEMMAAQMSNLREIGDEAFDRMLDAGATRLTRVAQDIRGCVPQG